MGFEQLLQTLEQYKTVAEDLPDSELFRVGVNAAWEKLDSYYNKLDQTPIYYTPLVLHPAYRWDYLDDVWSERPEWLAKARQIVEDVWIADYATLDIADTFTPPPNPEISGPPPSKKRKFFNPFEAKHLPVPTGNGLRSITGDEYRHWLRHPEKGDDEVRDPLAYWQAKQSQYLRLSPMALDFLTIQAMSAECERLFSSAGRILSGDRSSFDIRMVGMILSLRSWQRCGLIRNLHPEVLCHNEEDLKEETDLTCNQKLSKLTLPWLENEGNSEQDEENGEISCGSSSDAVEAEQNSGDASSSSEYEE